jgi:hypothetical protein
MLANADQGYTHPDTTIANNFVLNLVGRRELNDLNSLEGNIYYRTHLSGKFWGQSLEIIY